MTEGGGGERKDKKKKGKKNGPPQFFLLTRNQKQGEKGFRMEETKGLTQKKTQ